MKKLDRFQACMFHFKSKGRTAFENIDDVWSGLSRFFEAFFYSRPHAIKNRKEIELHFNLNENALACF